MKKELLSVILLVSLIFINACSEVSIQNEIDNANYCEVKEDCVNVGSKCPFGCDILVNKKEAGRIKDLVVSYKSNCIYQCIGIIDIKCENNKCLPLYS